MNTPHDTPEAPSTEPTPRKWPWWAPWAAAAAIAAIVIGVGTWVISAQDDDGGMGGMTSVEGMPPPVTGYYNGKQIQFLHTEASDAEVAGMLTDMMGGSPVVHTPSLAKVDEDLLAPVYAFTNGVQPDGPRGPFNYQPDVFDSVPGDPGYTPLRSVHLVEWQSTAEPRVLTTAKDVEQAEQAGDIDITRPGIVVNMPITTWPGGHR